MHGINFSSFPQLENYFSAYDDVVLALLSEKGRGSGDVIADKLAAMVSVNADEIKPSVLTLEKLDLTKVSEDFIREALKEKRFVYLTKDGENKKHQLHLVDGSFDTAPMFVHLIDPLRGVDAKISRDDLIAVDCITISTEEYEAWQEAIIESVILYSQARESEEEEESRVPQDTPSVSMEGFRAISQLHLFRIVVDKVAEIIESIFEADAAAREAVSASRREDEKRYDKLREEVFHAEEVRRLRKEKECEAIEVSGQKMRYESFLDVREKAEKSLGVEPLIAVGA